MKSVVNDSKYCIFCGNPATGTHHLIFGISSRAKSEQFGLKIPICDRCHNMAPIPEMIHGNIRAESLSKMLGQAIYERECALQGMSRTECRESFMKEFGKSFL